MQFCPTCDNKLYMSAGERESTDGTNEKYVLMFCKNCTYQHELERKEADYLCMYKSNYSKEHPLYYRSLVNTFTPNDITLPRSTTIECPYKDQHQEGDANEVVFVRYDDENLRYLYVCCAKKKDGTGCLTCWKMPGYQSNEVLFQMNSPD